MEQTIKVKVDYIPVPAMPKAKLKSPKFNFRKPMFKNGQKDIKKEKEKEYASKNE